MNTIGKISGRLVCALALINLAGQAGISAYHAESIAVFSWMAVLCFICSAIIVLVKGVE